MRRTVKVFLHAAIAVGVLLLGIPIDGEITPRKNCPDD